MQINVHAPGSTVFAINRKRKDPTLITEHTVFEVRVREGGFVYMLSPHPEAPGLGARISVPAECVASTRNAAEIRGKCGQPITVEFGSPILCKKCRQELPEGATAIWIRSGGPVSVNAGIYCTMCAGL